MAKRYRLPLFTTRIGLPTGSKEAASDGWFYPKNAAEETALVEAGCEADELNDPVRNDGTLRPDEVSQFRTLVLGDGIALRAWRTQPKSYRLAAVPDPTIFVDFNRGNDSTGTGARATPYKTLAKIQALAISPGISAGACIGLANDSTFDLTDRFSFSASGGSILNGASESSRITITNYNPGGVWTQRPRIRFRYTPTAGQWTWDATYQAWYYTNPNSRNFSRDALVLCAGKWGIQMSVNALPLTAGLLYKDFMCWSDDTNKRMYLYAPAGTNPTDYYGGAGSVILGESEGAALGFSRTGKFVTVDSLVFEECGLALQPGNFGSTESLAGFVAQRNSFIRCGKGVFGYAQTSSNYTLSAKILQNTFRDIAAVPIHTYCKALDWEIAGNYFQNFNEVMSAGGGIYAQENASGTTAHGNNIIYENYFEGAKFNTGNAPLDGACIYFEVGAKNWTATRNFMVKSHHGIYDNSGRPNFNSHNVFEDVDIPYSASDADSVGAAAPNFVHNTIVNCGLTKYRNGQTLDNVSAPINTNDNIGTGKTVDYRNNIISMADGVVPDSAINVRSTSVYDASGNHLIGTFPVPVRVRFNGATTATATPSGTTTGAVAFRPDYGTDGSQGAGVALSYLTNPVDLYGVSNVLPVKGAVSV